MHYLHSQFNFFSILLASTSSTSGLAEAIVPANVMEAGPSEVRNHKNVAYYKFYYY